MFHYASFLALLGPLVNSQSVKVKGTRKELVVVDFATIFPLQNPKMLAVSSQHTNIIQHNTFSSDLKSGVVNTQSGKTKTNSIFITSL